MIVEIIVDASVNGCVNWRVGLKNSVFYVSREELKFLKRELRNRGSFFIIVFEIKKIYSCLKSKKYILGILPCANQNLPKKVKHPKDYRPPFLHKKYCFINKKRKRKNANSPPQKKFLKKIKKFQKPLDK